MSSLFPMAPAKLRKGLVKGEGIEHMLRKVSPPSSLNSYTDYRTVTPGGGIGLE